MQIASANVFWSGPARQKLGARRTAIVDLVALLGFRR
jgi:hypothetical protein